MLSNFQDLIAKHNLKIDGVLHIGAHEGAEMLDYAKANIRYAILVEANPIRFKNLQKSIEGKRYPTWCSPLTYAPLPDDIKDNTKFYAYNYAVSDVDHVRVNLNVSDHDGGMDSLLQINDHGSKTAWVPYKHVDTVETYTIMIDSLMYLHGTRFIHVTKANKLIRPNFLNMDIEGAELIALRGAHHTLKHTDYILVETQDTPRFEGSCTKSELSSFLLQYGFKEADYFPSPYDWGDTLYIKEKRRPVLYDEELEDIHNWTNTDPEIIKQVFEIGKCDDTNSSS